MKKISLLLLVMACCFEVSAGRVGRHTLFRGNTAFRRQKLSNQSKEALQTTKKSLEDELKKVMVKAEKNSRTCFLEEFIQKNRAQGLFAFLLRDHLRDVTIVLAWKLKEEERLERALFGPEFVGQKQVITKKKPFIKQPRDNIKNNTQRRGR